jgi:cache domain-containing protein
MPFDVKISLQKLLTALVVLIVPLTVVGLSLTSYSDNRLQQTTGANFKIIAQADSALVSQFINDRVADVNSIAAETSLVDAITTSNRSHAQMSEESVAARTQKIEQDWNTVGNDSLTRELLSSRASHWLQQQRTANPRLLKVVVADQTGATVAATDRPLHYAQANNEYWPAVARGQGAVNVTDARYDERTRSTYIEIDTPVLERETGKFIGAVSALVDTTRLFSILNWQRVGQSGRVLLLRDDGTVISAANVGPELRLKAEEFPAVQDALATLEGRQTGYVVAATKSGNRIVGFADTGLKQSYPKLSWLILASQDEAEALASVRTLGRFALVMVVLGLLMLTLLLAYFSMHRQRELTAVEVVRSQETTKGKAASV